LIEGVMRKFGLLFFALATGAIMFAGGVNSGVNAGALSLMFGSDLARLVERVKSAVAAEQEVHLAGEESLPSRAGQSISWLWDGL
jgi:hypothetical protein